MFESREEAGELLALKLKKIVNKDFIVVPLLRGGIILGKRISDYFKIPLMPLAVKKIGAPLNPELAIGAVTFDKTYYFNERLVRELEVATDYKRAILEEKYKESRPLQKEIEKKAKQASWQGKNVIVVDDGIATGATAICAALYFKKQKVRRLILAVPMIPKDRINNIRRYFDEVVFLQTVNNLSSISEFYKYFPQVETEEVIEILSN